MSNRSKQLKSVLGILAIVIFVGAVLLVAVSLHT